MKKIIFQLVCYIHILIWLYVLFAFINKNTAYYNIYYIIPIIYLLHILPFHILTTYKTKLYPDTWEYKVEKVEKNIFFMDIYYYCSDKLFKNSTFNPFSPQGLLILGLITSTFRLYPPKYIKFKQFVY